MSKPRGRCDHAITVGAQCRQPPRHLARQPLDPTDLGADGGACVDRDDGRVSHRYCGRTVRRSASPQQSKPAPIATARPMSSPVRGSVEDVDGSAAWFDEDAVVAVALDDVEVVELLEDELALGAVDELEDVELGADGCVLVEPEPLLDPE